MSIVGWSLGGIYARRLAQRVPHQVRQVISLGSPFALAGRPVDDSPGARVYQRLAPVHTTGRTSIPRGSLARPLPVPSTAVYSRWDGVVDWRACRQKPGPRSENVAVRSSHLGMGHDPAVLWVVADRLAQPARPMAPVPAADAVRPGCALPAGGLSPDVPYGEDRRRATTAATTAIDSLTIDTTPSGSSQLPTSSASIGKATSRVAA